MAGDARCLVVAGVAGSGKTTLARAVAEQLGWTFLEGDDLHPPANITRMAAGQPLRDEDRRPWLDAIGRRIDAITAAGGDLVVTCSALRRSYREELRRGRSGVEFCLVVAPRAVIAERLRHRTGHFMPASLLDSQLATLELLGPDEPGFVVEATGPLPIVVGAVLSRLERPTPA